MGKCRVFPLGNAARAIPSRVAYAMWVPSGDHATAAGRVEQSHRLRLRHEVMFGQILLVVLRYFLGNFALVRSRSVVVFPVLRLTAIRNVPVSCLSGM